MAIWSRRTKTNTRQEFVLPLHEGSVVSARVVETIEAAWNALAEERRIEAASLPDNSVKVAIDGASLVVFYETAKHEVHG